MTTYTISPNPRSEFEPSPRWVRVYFNSQLIADSRNMRLLRENNRLPLYYFPKPDVMIAGVPYTVIQRAMHIHPTVTELIPTMLGDLKPLE